MNSVRRIVSRAGVCGVVVAAALTAAVATAGSASAERVGGGYYSTYGECDTWGQRYVNSGAAWAWHCAEVTSGGPHQGQIHLIIFT